VKRSWHVHTAGPLRGEVRLPGDKSISHRAILLNLLGEGSATVRGLNDGADVTSTITALRRLGARIEVTSDAVRVEGRTGRLRPATDAIDCGNSGTTMRLLAGLLAAQPFSTTLDGDASLRRRPMARIAEPLRRFGARVEGPDGGRHAPLVVTGGELAPRRFDLTVASAQVKSCLLVAACASRCEVEVRSPGVSRDHTERMLEAMGAVLDWDPLRAHLLPGAHLHCVDVDVPGDPSAAAQVAAAAMPIAGSRISLRNMLLNPTRSAFLGVLERMGVRCTLQETHHRAGEPMADVTLHAPSHLRPVDVGRDVVPSLIDEIPALAVVAAFAPGKSRFTGVGELRFKESDRVATTASLLDAFGIETTLGPDTLVVHGGRPALPDRVEGTDDHRLAMAAVALTVATQGQSTDHVITEVAPVDSIGVSFPDFDTQLKGLGVHVGA
jgi:3-phosphoshikimate 1-carboxyvinyltransferase